MRNCIVVEYCPFEANSKITVCKDGEQIPNTAPTNLDEVTYSVVSFAHAYGVYDVKICGPVYISDELDDMMREYERKRYSDNKIKVEKIRNEIFA